MTTKQLMLIKYGLGLYRGMTYNNVQRHDLDIEAKVKEEVLLDELTELIDKLDSFITVKEK